MYNLGKKNAAAGPVPFVHGDYSDKSGPNRIRQLANKPSYTGTTLNEKDVESILSKRFIFINVWRNTKPEPVTRMPLAVCDATTIPKESMEVYELRYPDRVGENYCVATGKVQEHKWFYYP